MEGKFGVGDRVRIKNDYLVTYGKIGTVVGLNECVDSIKYNVVLDEKTTDFCYNETSLELLCRSGLIYGERNENNMNTKVTGNYDIAAVKFLQGSNTTKGYSFALFDSTICEGDIVLCDTTYGYQVAKVDRIFHKDDYDGVDVTKEVICKLDFSDFEQRKERRRLKEELKKKMDEELKRTQELLLYQTIAEKNPEMKALLDEYAGLNDI